MRRYKTLFVFACSLLLALAQVPSAGAAHLRDWDPIAITNLDPENWEIKVWAYSAQTTTIGVLLGPSCQTLERSSANTRWIQPWYSIFETENHCGNFTELQVYFRVWKKGSDEYEDMRITNPVTVWGAQWTWNGKWWSCTGCR